MKKNKFEHDNFINKKEHSKKEYSMDEMLS